MFLRINKTSELENYISKAFSLYKDTILNLHKKEWKEEDIRGKSCVKFDIYQYYLAIYYVVLIYLEIKQSGNYDYQYYNKKYKLTEISKCLSCFSIDLQGILNIFTITFTNCNGGIECFELEKDFEIEPIFLNVLPTYEKVNIKDLLLNQSKCEILLPTNCNQNINLDYILQLDENQMFLIL